MSKWEKVYNDYHIKLDKVVWIPWGKLSKESRTIWKIVLSGFRKNG